MLASEERGRLKLDSAFDELLSLRAVGFVALLPVASKAAAASLVRGQALLTARWRSFTACCAFRSLGASSSKSSSRRKMSLSLLARSTGSNTSFLAYLAASIALAIYFVLNYRRFLTKFHSIIDTSVLF